MLQERADNRPGAVWQEQLVTLAWRILYLYVRTQAWEGENGLPCKNNTPDPTDSTGTASDYLLRPTQCVILESCIMAFSVILLLTRTRQTKSSEYGANLALVLADSDCGTFSHLT